MIDFDASAKEWLQRMGEAADEEHRHAILRTALILAFKRGQEDAAAFYEEECECGEDTCVCRP